uniref:Uncharacterized protein n=1 Tax=Romanomermis culicivorax TaxID=13658 RepID=A0A915J5U1_ROMCU
MRCWKRLISIHIIEMTTSVALGDLKRRRNSDVKSHTDNHPRVASQATNKGSSGVIETLYPVNPVE